MKEKRIKSVCVNLYSFLKEKYFLRCIPALCPLLHLHYSHNFPYHVYHEMRHYELTILLSLCLFYVQ